jgi:hypothetical protein
MRVLPVERHISAGRQRQRARRDRHGDVLPVRHPPARRYFRQLTFGRIDFGEAK